MRMENKNGINKELLEFDVEAIAAEGEGKTVKVKKSFVLLLFILVVGAIMLFVFSMGKGSEVAEKLEGKTIEFHCKEKKEDYIQTRIGTITFKEDMQCIEELLVYNNFYENHMLSNSQEEVNEIKDGKYKVYAKGDILLLEDVFGYSYVLDTDTNGNPVSLSDNPDK